MSKNYFADFNSVDSKLVDLLDDNQLVRRFNTDKYPITLTITQNIAPEAQMAMFTMAEDGVSSRDAKLVISFPVGEVGIRVSGRLIISDALMNKIKGFAKKMHYLYLQGEYAMRSEVVGFPRVQPIEPAEDEEATTAPDEFADFFEGAGDQEEE